MRHRRDSSSSSSAGSRDTTDWSDDDGPPVRPQAERKSVPTLYVWILLGLLGVAVIALVVIMQVRDGGQASAIPSLAGSDGEAEQTGAAQTSAAANADAGSAQSASAPPTRTTDKTRPTASASPPSASNSSPATKPPSNDTKGPYKLVRSHAGTTFFDGWEFFSEVDPTEGQVNYLKKDAAQKAGLFSATEKSAIMRVDNTTKLAKGANRDSVRIESAQPAEIGSLIIADIIRMPWGCATWPAWWSYGDPDWPDGGEIDVIEGVNLDPANVITLHTNGDGCKPASKPDISGTVIKENVICDVASGNGGCSYGAGEKSYGKDFNDAGGGVYATLFMEEGISVWFWTRSAVPEHLADPSTWGKPTANWPSSSCDIKKFFSHQRLIFNITLCGEYAGAPESWARASACKQKAATCSDFLVDPSNFDEAVWEIRSVKIYAK
ncbi:hypothetical protein JCM10908_004702 [Rhodotorula pacifica]|uniref:glycoside hydrolase family 16 protein n=1 Tax=Rhodotorula pacifica TaxID=1495444 RepID=UPI00316EF52A